MNKDMWYEDRDRIILKILDILNIEDISDEKSDLIDELFEAFTTGDYCNHN